MDIKKKRIRDKRWIKNHPKRARELWKLNKRKQRLVKKANEYVRLYQPHHPFSDAKGRVPEHRLIMEKKLNRFLTKNEVVHHIDGNILNNNVENLKLMLKKEHDSFHRLKRGLLGISPQPSPIPAASG